MTPARRDFDPVRIALRLGISREAIELYATSDVVDLHADTFIWTRLFGYDLNRRHGPGPLGARFMGQVDIPRLIEAGVTGATWVVTTNPLRSARGRAKTFFENLGRLRSLLRQCPEKVALVRNAAEYRAARAAGKLGAFIGIQGGNALDHDLDDWAKIPEDLVTRVTLVHLSPSRIGTTSFPVRGRDAGLTPLGHAVVERLNQRRILVDLAHASKKTFQDAVACHDPALPFAVTHTGVSGVRPHWRNLDDDQLRAVARAGGTVGIMYHGDYLSSRRGRARVSDIADHLQHVVRVAGEDHASLGSDWDGAIVTPNDMPTCLEVPRLAQILLERRWSAERVGKVLGGNYLRVLTALRG